MKSWRLVVWLSVSAVGMSCFASTAATSTYEKYQSIITRSPFKKLGTEGAGPSQAAVGNLSLTGYYFAPKVKKVWLKDKQSNKSYCVGEGEEVLGYHVDKIDAQNQTVVLSHGVESQTLSFPINAAPPAPAAPVPGARSFFRPSGRPGLAPAPNAPPPAVTPAPSWSPAAQGTNGPSSSLRRRIMRQNLRPAQGAEAGADETKAAEDAEEKAAQEAVQQ